MNASLRQKAVSEALGTAFLLAAVIGSGVMAERLAQGNVEIALLANSIATGGALVAILLALGPVRGALPWNAVPSWPLPDPKGKPLAEVRAIRDQIRERVAARLREIG